MNILAVSGGPNLLSNDHFYESRYFAIGYRIKREY